MTTPQNDRYIRYAPDGGTTVLNYDFTIYEEIDLAVARLRDEVITVLTLATDYTVSDVGEDGGGYITLTEDSLDDDIYVLYGVNEYRAADYTQAGDFLAADVNRDVDKLTQTTQQLRRDIVRSIHLPITDSTSFDMTLALPEERANKFLGFDADGALTYLSSTETGIGTNVEITGGTITGLTELEVDNLRLDGNTISATNPNGNIILSPDGSGYVGIDESYILLDEIDEPGTPAAGKVALYAKDDGRLYIKDDAGSETDLTAAGGGGAPDSAEYLVLGLNGGLTNERVLVPTEGIQGTDGGAGGNYTIKLNINGLTADATPDASADYFVTYDASAGTHKKLLMSNLINGLAADASPAAANDYVLTYDASAGTLKKVLLTNLPTAGGVGGGWELLAVQSAAGSASLDFTASIDNTYNVYVFVLENIVPATNHRAIFLRVSTDGGFSYANTSYANPNAASTTTDSVLCMDRTASSSATEGVCGTIYMYSPADPAVATMFNGTTYYQTGPFTNGPSDMVSSTIISRYTPTAAVNAVRFAFSSGTIVSGSIRMYGISTM